MKHDCTADDQCDDTHARSDCPGCGYGGNVGAPRSYPADVVVCPTCRQVVPPQPEDRVVWRPNDAELLLCRRFSDIDQKTAGQCNEPRESRANRKPAASGRGRAVSTAGRKPARRRVSELLDKEPVQFALIIAAGIVPLALAIFLPRAMYRARSLDRQQVARRDETTRDGARATASDQSPREVTPTTAKREAPMPRPVVDPRKVKPIAKREPAPPDYDALYRRGKRRRAKGDYLAAIGDFDEVLRARPEFAWCYYDRAGAYFLIGNQQAALADLDRAVVVMPREPKVWHARAVLHQRMGRPKEAVAEIWRAVERGDGDAASGDRAFTRLLRSKADELTNELFANATALVRSGQYEAAIHGFTEVVIHRPDCASAWLRRGLAYDQRAQYDKALADLNIALDLRPGPAQAFKLRSVLHERNENHAAALADMLAALRLDPTNRKYADRISCLRRQQQTQESMRRQYARH